MKPLKKKMIEIYNMKNYDFLGYAYDRKQDLTFHHIIKKCDGGLLRANNGAILTNLCHNYIHIIERVYPIIYQEITYILKELNKKETLPTLEEIVIIDKVFKKFEELYLEKLNSKNKLIIRPECIVQREKGIERVRSYFDTLK